MNSQQTVRIVLTLLFVSIYSFNLNANSMNYNNIQVQDNDSVFAVVDKDPEFPGGTEAQLKFMGKNLRYPIEAAERNQQGRVIVQFIVRKTGKISNVKVVKSGTPLLDKEAIRIVELFPNWIPGEKNGEKVSSYQLIPVTFKFANNSSKSENPDLVVIDGLKMPAEFDISILNVNEIDTGYVRKPVTSELKEQLLKKYGPDAENGAIEIYTKRFKKFQNKIENNAWDTIAIINPNDANAVYHIIEVDKRPEFSGGEKGLFNFISKNLKYPLICQQTGIQGTVIVQFVVDRTGKVKDAVVKNKIHSSLATEALRVINCISDWSPGEKHGRKVNVMFTLPIKFKSNNFELPLENDSTVDSKLFFDRQLVILNDKILPYGFDLNWLNLSEIQSYKLLTPKDSIEVEKFKRNFGPSSSKGVFVAYSKRYYSANRKDSYGNKIYDVIEQMPEFLGGETALLNYMSKNLQYPVNARNNHIQGRVITRFVVNSSGKVEQAEVLRGIDPECDKEALRVLNSLPDFIPGKQNGKNVSVWYTMPISFRQ